MMGWIFSFCCLFSEGFVAFLTGGLGLFVNFVGEEVLFSRRGWGILIWLTWKVVEYNFVDGGGF